MNPKIRGNRSPSRNLNRKSENVANVKVLPMTNANTN